MPLIVFAVVVAADYANVARFTTRVQHAADAAAAAVSRTIARNPNVDGRDVDQIAERIKSVGYQGSREFKYTKWRCLRC
jgi:hypothetical protein